MLTFIDDLMILLGIIVVCATVVVIVWGVLAFKLGYRKIQAEEAALPVEERTVEITFSPDTSPVEQLRVMRTVMRAIDEPMPQPRTTSRSTDVTIWNGIEGW